MVCTFFGHSECYGLDADILLNAIEHLINQDVDNFYVGNHGQFDGMVHGCLKQLRAVYPHIRYAVVLAYLPGEKRGLEALPDTVFPEGVEVGAPRFAIERRNRWMLDASDYCLCYINHTWGGAYKFARMAKRRGLTVINMGSADL